jgi:cyanophycin synthetase
MEFRKILALRGPNIWSKSPVLEAWVDLGDLKDSPSNELPGFNDRIMRWLPQMIEHRCSVGERGGFFERLRRGTYLAHILEHVTLELQTRAGANFGFGRARESSQEGLFRVAVRCDDEALGRACLEVGRRLCLAAVHDQPFDVDLEIKKLRELADRVCLGPSSRAIAAAATARGIPIRRLNSGSLVQFGYGAKARRTLTAETDRTSGLAETIAQDKDLTRSLLRQVGVPVPSGRPVSDAADAWKAAQEIGGLVVVKPRYGNQGRGVVVGVSTREQVEAAYQFARAQGPDIVVEQCASGAEHRLLIVDGKLIAAVRGNPAHITGDGQHTIAELIETQLNSDPRRGDDLSFPLDKITLNPPVLLMLEQQGYKPDNVLPPGTQVVILRNGNLAIDVTDDVHPEFARWASLAARVVGLDVAGIDLLADDISQIPAEQNAAVIEVNAGPGLQMHIEPESGIPRPVGEAIIGTLFAEGQDGRIPIVSVMGAEHVTAVSQWIARLWATKVENLGLASAEGTFVAGTRVKIEDSRGADDARGLLLNPLVEAAVFEASVDRILEEGLAFDRCDVAVVTSIGEGLKLDFLEWDSPEKKVLVYRSASDVILPGGSLVMPAGEALGPLVSQHSGGALVLFAEDEHDASLKAHLAAGGSAVFARKGRIVHAEGDRVIDVAPLVAGVAPAVLLAAVAAAWALGVGVADIAAGLKTV